MSNHAISHSAVSCPECGHQFSPEAAIENSLREKLEIEYSQKRENENAAIRSQVLSEAQSEFQQRFDEMRKDFDSKSIRLLELERKEISWVEREKALRAKEEEMELTLKRKILEIEDNIRKEAETRGKEKALLEFQEEKRKLVQEKEDLEVLIGQRAGQEIERVRVEAELKQRELLKKLDEQNILVSELKRKAEQGSVQLQGEVQELALEEFLSASYPFDQIDPVGKGVNGADCIQTVKTSSGRTCGKIIYESKRTKHFGAEWIEKLKDDMRAAGCDIAILVTQIYPTKEMIRFGMIDGVWVCNFAEVKSISLILRGALLKAGEALASQENKGTKMQILYDYLTGTEFRNYVETIVEAFGGMRTDLDREKRAFHKIWAEREKQLERVLASTMNMFGSVKGIAGSAFQDIPSLELLEPPAINRKEGLDR